MSSTFSSVRAISSRSLRPGRGDGEAAVAGDHGGDAVEARRRQRRVPEHLGVVVGVDVDEAGGDDAAGGVDDRGARVLGDEVVADADDHPVGKRHIGATARRAGAVDDGSPMDHGDITHATMIALPATPPGSQPTAGQRRPSGRDGLAPITSRRRSA